MMKREGQIRLVSLNSYGLDIRWDDECMDERMMVNDLGTTNC